MSDNLKIKFGTDGWRAVIAKEFTTNNVARVSAGVASYIKNYDLAQRVVLGFDCRFGGKLFAETAAQVLSSYGIEVLYFNKPTTTPAISLAAYKMDAGLGIILTASHNPPTYNGYKLKGGFGGPLLSEGISQVEELIPDGVPNLSKANSSLIVPTDFNQLYIDHIKSHFDLDRINRSDMKMAYDAMYGSGQFVLPEILPNAVLFRNEWNHHFYGLSPEPIMKNLGEFQHFLRNETQVDLALINDGDADRIGLMDGDGNFIDSHNIMLLLLHYLVHYKGLKGRVATGFSSTVKIQHYCKLHGLELDIVPIGFKHICGIMLEHEVLMGGEESGGIAVGVGGHIPERDGIWNGLLLLEMMVVTGKSINELLQEIRNEVGSFAFRRIDLQLKEEQKLAIVEQCRSNHFSRFGELEVKRIEDLDGWKYYFNEDEWVMIRPSGTEPVLRTYAEGVTTERAEFILENCHKEILG
ncbi:MAG: phosphoglucosamine mutase [Crocinitomicaceae bacterium]|nr:phosphoglucosamine mutase [Crocinitomicaceae bacterium]